MEAAAEHPGAGFWSSALNRDLPERLLHLFGGRRGVSGLWCTDNMYWVMGVILSGGSGSLPEGLGQSASHHCYERPPS